MPLTGVPRLPVSSGAQPKLSGDPKHPGASPITVDFQCPARVRSALGQVAAVACPGRHRTPEHGSHAQKRREKKKRDESTNRLTLNDVRAGHCIFLRIYSSPLVINPLCPPQTVVESDLSTIHFSYTRLLRPLVASTTANEACALPQLPSPIPTWTISHRKPSKEEERSRTRNKKIDWRRGGSVRSLLDPS